MEPCPLPRQTTDVRRERERLEESLTGGEHGQVFVVTRGRNSVSEHAGRQRNVRWLKASGANEFRSVDLLIWNWRSRLRARSPASPYLSGSRSAVKPTSGARSATTFPACATNSTTTGAPKFPRKRLGETGTSRDDEPPANAMVSVSSFSVIVAPLEYCPANRASVALSSVKLARRVKRRAVTSVPTVNVAPSKRWGSSGTVSFVMPLSVAPGTKVPSANGTSATAGDSTCATVRNGAERNTDKCGADKRAEPQCGRSRRARRPTSLGVGWSEGGGRVRASPSAPCGQNGPQDISSAITVHRHEESISSIDIDQEIGGNTRIAPAMEEDPVPVAVDMDEVTKAHLGIAHVDRLAVDGQGDLGDRAGQTVARASPSMIVRTVRTTS